MKTNLLFGHGAIRREWQSHTPNPPKHRLYLLLICVVLLFLCPAVSFADTYVSGAITEDTTWTLAGSPYIVTGNVLVMEGVTLTIEPGVVVKFNSGLALQVDGQLIARGAIIVVAVLLSRLQQARA